MDIGITIRQNCRANIWVVTDNQQQITGLTWKTHSLVIMKPITEILVKIIGFIISHNYHICMQATIKKTIHLNGLS